MKDQEERITKLEQKVQLFYNIIWVVGIIAVIFGISGAWGYKALLETRNVVTKLQEDAKNIDKIFATIRASHEKSFDEHAAQKTSEFDDHVQNSQTIRFGDKVRLRNEAYNRCMDLEAGRQWNLQLIGCKGTDVPNQTWTLDRR